MLIFVIYRVYSINKFQVIKNANKFSGVCSFIKPINPQNYINFITESFFSVNLFNNNRFEKSLAVT